MFATFLVAGCSKGSYAASELSCDAITQYDNTGSGQTIVFRIV